MSLQALYEQAPGNHKRGDLVAAEGIYRQVLAASPQSFAAWHMLGVLKAQQGAVAEALDLLAAAVGQKSDAHDAQFNYGNVLKNAGRSEEALAAYDRALDQKPDYTVARNARAKLLNSRGNRPRETGQLSEVRHELS